MKFATLIFFLTAGGFLFCLFQGTTSLHLVLRIKNKIKKIGENVPSREGKKKKKENTTKISLAFSFSWICKAKYIWFQTFNSFTHCKDTKEYFPCNYFMHLNMIITKVAAAGCIDVHTRFGLILVLLQPQR